MPLLIQSETVGQNLLLYKLFFHTVFPPPLLYFSHNSFPLLPPQNTVPRFIPFKLSPASLLSFLLTYIYFSSHLLFISPCFPFLPNCLFISFCCLTFPSPSRSTPFLPFLTELLSIHPSFRSTLTPSKIFSLPLHFPTPSRFFSFI